MARSSLSIEIDAERLTALLDALAVRAALAPSDLVDRVRKILERPGDLFRAAITLDGDGLPASGAGDLRIVLEPTELLLELALAAGAGEGQFDIHRGSPVGE